MSERISQMCQHTWFVTKIQNSFYLMAFVQKINRTQTLCRSASVFRYKLCQNYLKEGFLKKNNCTKKRNQFYHNESKLYTFKSFIVFQRPFRLLLQLILKRHNKQKRATLLLRKSIFVKEKVFEYQCYPESYCFLDLFCLFVMPFFKKLHSKVVVS